MKYLYLLIVVLCFSCNEYHSSRNKLSHPPTSNDSLKIKILGKWGDFKNPMWDIREDSIYYFERSVAYPYKILNDNLIIYLPKSNGILRKIHVIKDTLFFLDEEGLTVKAYRFNKRR